MAFIHLDDTDIIINTDHIASINHGGVVFGNTITMASGEKFKVKEVTMKKILSIIGE